jgi:four helix bundle protein
MSESQYRNLIAWQRARTLAVTVYRVTQNFPRTEIYGLTQQLRRATVSAISNIAEGHGRRSVKETLHFLGIARGSLFEVETQVVIANDLEYAEQTQTELLIEQTLEVIRLVNGLIRHLEERSS